MTHSTVLRFSYPSVRAARVVAESVRQEAGRIPGDRTTGHVTREGAELVVELEAADLPALRAGVNTWCSLVETAESVLG